VHQTTVNYQGYPINLSLHIVNDWSLLDYAGVTFYDCSCAIMCYDTTTTTTTNLNHTGSSNSIINESVMVRLKERGLPIILAGTKYDLVNNNVGDQQILQFVKHFSTMHTLAGAFIISTRTSCVPAEDSVVNLFTTALECGLKYNIEHKACLCSICIHLYDLYISKGPVKYIIERNHQITTQLNKQRIRICTTCRAVLVQPTTYCPDEADNENLSDIWDIYDLCLYIKTWFTPNK